MLVRAKSRLYRLLRWSERYTKTDMVYFASGSFWIAVSQVVYIITAFALSVAFANLLSKESYGTYRFVLSIAAIIATFGLTGIDTAIPQAVARGYEGMLRKGFGIYLRWGFGMLLGGAAVAAYYLTHGNTALAYSFIVVGLASPLFAGASLYGEFLTGRRAFKALAGLTITQSIFTMLVLLGTMTLTENVPVLVSAYFLSNALGAFTLYHIVLRRFKPNDRIDPESTRFGYHVSATNVLGTIADQLDKILVFHLLGAAQLALYSIAALVPEYVRSASKIFNNLAQPKYAKRSKEDLRAIVVPKTLQLLGLLAIAAAAYALLVPYLFAFLFPHYLESIPYSQVFALIILAGASNIPGAMLTSQRAVRAQYTMSITDNISKIFLLFVLTYSFGLWGVVAARILGRLISLILSIVLTRRLI